MTRRTRGDHGVHRGTGNEPKAGLPMDPVSIYLRADEPETPEQRKRHLRRLIEQYGEELKAGKITQDDHDRWVANVKKMLGIIPALLLAFFTRGR